MYLPSVFSYGNPWRYRSRDKSCAYVTTDSELTAKQFCGIISSATWQMETALSRGRLDNQTEYLRGEYFKVPGSSHYFPRRRLSSYDVPRSMYYYHARFHRRRRRFRFNNSARFLPFVWQVFQLSARRLVLCVFRVETFQIKRRRTWALKALWRVTDRELCNQSYFTVAFKCAFKPLEILKWNILLTRTRYFKHFFTANKKN